MNYEKKYKDALKRAKKLYEQGTITESLNYVFPELKESEDELTWLTKYIEEEAYSLSIDIRDDKDRIKLKKLQESLAWLEKQGEQKPADKVEPKFKVGDWITFYGGELFKILKIESEQNGILNYLLLDQNGRDSYYNKKYVNKNARLWTLQDANEGDVLVHNNILFIFMGIENGVVKGICRDLSDTISNFGMPEYNNDYYPTTKEQRKLLFQKMKEAGYEWWNAEKKELKKTDRLDPLIDEEIDLWIKENSNIHCNDNDVIELMRDMAYYVATLTRNLYRQKPKWTEEDEKSWLGIIDEIEANKSNAPDYDIKTYDMFLSWLRLLKQRMEE